MLLTFCLQGCSFQFVFQLVFPAYTVQLHSISVLPTAFKTLCSNKLGIPTGTSWHFSDISSDISAWWAPEGTSLDVNKANGMLTSNAKRIFFDSRAAKFTKNKNDQWNHAGVFSISICAGLSLKMQPRNNY